MEIISENFKHLCSVSSKMGSCSNISRKLTFQPSKLLEQKYWRIVTKTGLRNVGDGRVERLRIVLEKGKTLLYQICFGYWGRTDLCPQGHRPQVKFLVSLCNVCSYHAWCTQITLAWYQKLHLLKLLHGYDLHYGSEDTGFHFDI